MEGVILVCFDWWLGYFVRRLSTYYHRPPRSTVLRAQQSQQPFWRVHSTPPGTTNSQGPIAQLYNMADAAAQKEYSITEVVTHTTKESTWLIIKDMNDGGE